ncbi:MAG: hemolysin family protein [Armatimonadota bacterium]|nr:hemolysin family protein [Armatimonadota bacterium]MDR5697194.1 hemolysin family protein [Armatimonadota bacterium]
MDDSSSELGRYFLAAVLVSLSAFFSVAEVALFGANRQRLRQLADEGHLRASVALRLLDTPSRILSTLTVGQLLAEVGLAVVAASLAIRRLGSGWGEVVAVVAAAGIVLLAARIVPRTAAARAPDALAVMCAVPLRAFEVVLWPVTTLLGRLPSGHAIWERAPLTEEHIRLMVRIGEANGALEEGEREMIHSIFELGETLAREIMVPRVDIQAIPHDARLLEIVDRAMEEGHSRIPVYRDTIDHIVGVVYVKDLFRYLREGRTDVTAADVMRRAYYVPETKKVGELFREMRQNNTHIVIVVDEYGGTAGLVTIEDVLEEIVGEIRDEYDVEEREPLVMVDEHTAIVDARMQLDEVNERLRIELPADEVDTLGGFVYSRVGHVPQLGEEITYDGVRIRVEELDGQRIARLRVHKMASAQEARA